MTSPSDWPTLLSWLTPSFAALLLYGVGQGLVKKYIGDIHPARFCLFFVVAKAFVNLGYFFTQAHPNPFSPEGRITLLLGIFVYILDGMGWILYFQSIIYGPIAIVGTLSAAYPALTVLWAQLFLGEKLLPIQYLGVALVILGCVGLSFESSPHDAARPKSRRWIPLAGIALLVWSASQTLMKYTYRLPLSSEVNLALFNTIGGFLTLGTYGLLFGRGSTMQVSQGGQTSISVGQGVREWLTAFLPMAMMAGGDLGVIIASKNGPISIVTPLTGAYPVITLIFAALILKERISRLQIGCILLILLGIILTPGASA